MNDSSASPEQKNIVGLIRPHLLAGEEYIPIEPVEVLGALVEKPAAEIIKLDGNENPYGCSLAVREALRTYPYYHIYPDPAQREFRKAVARYVGVGEEHIVGGSGSDDLLELIVRLFVGPGDRVINCVPTFGMYSFLTGLYRGKIVDIKRDEDFELDSGNIRAAFNKKTKVVFVASPNNPSGNVTAAADIVSLLGSNVIVVVDEAYAEFSGVSLASLVPEHDNLIVLRTFSKWAGLAGLRVGYGIFPRELVPYLMKIKQPYNVNCAAQVAALASLQDISYLRQNIANIVDERERLFQKLKSLSFLRPCPSRANFVLCQVLQGQAKGIQDKLKKKGIFVRYFDTPLLRSYLRITVGKPAHTTALIKELKIIGDSL
ncbi:MAG: histidinol-phosphate transaminase [Chloroflexi bacterium]|nr:histidinol-phosphate transaminase [Chloroflexota bacterium]